MKLSNLLSVIVMMLASSIVAFAQNINSSNALSARTEFNLVMVVGVGVVMLVAGAVIGYAIGRKKS